MIRAVFVSINLRQALSFLTKRLGQTCCINEISRLTGISYGGTSVLAESIMVTI